MPIPNNLEFLTKYDDKESEIFVAGNRIIRIAYSADGSIVIELPDTIELPDNHGRFRPFDNKEMQSKINWNKDKRSFSLTDEYGGSWEVFIETKSRLTRQMVEGMQGYVAAASALRKAINDLDSACYEAGKDHAKASENSVTPAGMNIFKLQAARDEVDRCMQELWDF